MKERFIKSTIILVIGGLITKILAMVIRIIITRTIGTEGIGLYMMVMPTFTLFVTISSLSLTTSISKVVAEDNRNNRNVVFGVVPVAMIFNVIVVLFIIICAPFIANRLLQNNDLYYPLLATGLTLPFITLSSIARGYFFGKQKMIPHVTSNIVEQIIRIIVIMLVTPFLLKQGIIYAITGLILLNILSELASIIVLFLFLPKRFKLNKNDLKYNESNIKDTFAISIPTTMGRLISSVGLFLEPIVITFVFLKLGYNTFEITMNYGIISGYVLPMVAMPSFLSGAISSALLPVVTKYYEEKKINHLKNKIKQAILLSLAVGIPFTIIMILFPEFCLNVLFNTNEGINLLRIAAPIYLIAYIEGPLVSSLHAMNKSNTVLLSSVIGNIIKIVVLFITSYFNIGMLSLLIAYLFYLLYITIHQIIAVKKLV